MVVLKYLKSESTRFKTFIANRVPAILEHSQASQWRYVNTSLNPADHVSRGQSIEVFLKFESWLSGLSFLLCGKDQWPKNPDPGKINVGDPEVKGVQSHVIKVQDHKDPLGQLMMYYSSWTKLKQVVAWFWNWKICWKKRTEPSSSSSQKMNKFKEDCKETQLTFEDLTKAETEIVKYAQRQGFQEDLERATKSKEK